MDVVAQQPRPMQKVDLVQPDACSATCNVSNTSVADMVVHNFQAQDVAREVRQARWTGRTNPSQ